MEKNKTAIAALLVTAGLLALFAFTSKRTYKPGDTIYCFAGQHKHIGSLIQSEIKNVNNWTAGSACKCEHDNYLCAITFTSELVANGGNDGKLTLQEAVDALWDYFNAHSNRLPPQGNCFTIGSGSGSTPAVVCIYRKPANE